MLWVKVTQSQGTSISYWVHMYISGIGHHFGHNDKERMLSMRIFEVKSIAVFSRSIVWLPLFLKINLEDLFLCKPSSVAVSARWSVYLHQQRSPVPSLFGSKTPRSRFSLTIWPGHMLHVQHLKTHGHENRSQHCRSRSLMDCNAAGLVLFRYFFTTFAVEI